MKKGLRNILIGIATLVTVGLLGVFVQQLRDSQGEDLTKLLGIEQKLSVPIPKDVVVRDEEGNSRQIGEFLSDRPTVLMLIFFTCRSACTTEFEGALKSFRGIKNMTIGKDYDVLTVSIHPKESAELAKAKKDEYLDFYNRPGAEKGWRFLTGDYDQVQKLAKQVGFKYSYDETKDRVIHPTGLILLTPSGKVSKYFLGTDYPTAYLKDSIAAAGQNQIGSVAEPVSIGCFMYDPSTGKTMIHVKKAIQLAGGVTLSILIFSIVGMIRREKNYHNQAQPEAPEE